MFKRKIYIAHVTMDDRYLKDCVGYALVEDATQLNGYRVISTHVSSDFAWSVRDMQGMRHDKDYDTACPEGWVLVDLGEFHATTMVSDVAGEIIAAIRRFDEQEGDAE